MHPLDARRLLTAQLDELASDDGRKHDVTIALARIDAGEWGQCAACRGDIAPERLADRPTSTHCASCDVVVLDGFGSGEWLASSVAITPLPAAG